MKKLAFLLSAAAVMAGCTASGPKPGTDGKPLPRPYGLAVEASTDELTLTWQVDRRSDQVFSGYNIYIAERPIIGTDNEAALLEHTAPHNQLPFPGDTDADISRETFVAEGLDSGKRYYCFVRALGLGGRLGQPSNEVMAICRPKGRAAIQKIFSGETDGFDFSKGRYVNTDAIDCDLAFYFKDGTDHLIAPYKIDPLLNETRFWDLGGAAAFDKFVEPDLKGDGVPQISAHANHTYAYRTADGHYGKFWIESIGGEGNQRTIRFLFMYQTIPNLIYLK